jgi:hypothetical protein
MQPNSRFGSSNAFPILERFARTVRAKTAKTGGGVWKGTGSKRY